VHALTLTSVVTATTIRRSFLIANPGVTSQTAFVDPLSNRRDISCNIIECSPAWRERFWVAVLLLLIILCMDIRAHAAERSKYILYDNAWIGTTTSKHIVLDPSHQQIFVALRVDRVEVLSSVDYHLIRSIPMLSPASVDISPDGTTVAVATLSSHILFFDTTTFDKTNDVVFPDSGLGVSAFLYAGNGNGLVRADVDGGGITAYWDHLANAFINRSTGVNSTGPYYDRGVMARSGDYSRFAAGAEQGEAEDLNLAPASPRPHRWPPLQAPIP
jgi:hypothetical protein